MFFYNGGTDKMKAYPRTIAKCKAYEANGLPNFLKVEARGIRRNLENQLDKEKEARKEAYQEACWN